MEVVVEDDNMGCLGDLEALFETLFKMKGCSSLAFHFVATRDEDGEYVDWYIKQRVFC